MTRVLFIVFLAGSFWSTSVEAQEDIKAYAIATNFSASNKVLELTLPPEVDGERFVIVWKSGADQSVVLRVARAGTHSYEMRHLPKWTGSIDVVATNLQVMGRV